MTFRIKQTKSDLSNMWSTYQPVSPNLKQGDYNYKNEIQHIIKDIENVSLSDFDAWQRHSNQTFNDELKQKIKDIKIGPNEYSVLHFAAKNLRKTFCSFLIQDVKIDKDVRCKSKSTPLHQLIKSNIFFKQDFISTDISVDKKNAFRDTFSTLIEKNCDVNLQDDLGYSALHNAVVKNNYAGVLCLLNVPSLNINLEDKKGSSALHLACKYGYDEIAELLINKVEADKLLLCDGSNMTALHLACRYKTEKFNIVKQMLEKLRQATIKSRNIPNYLDAALKKEDNNREALIHIAIENNHLNIVEVLLRDFNVNKEQRDGQFGNLPIHIAAKNGSIEMFELLKKYDAISFKTNNNQENALHIAAFYNKHKFIREFLNYENKLISEQKHDENSPHMPCICVCECEESHEYCIKQRDRNKYTPLLTAMSACNQKCVEELLADKNVEITAKDREGNSILNVCTEFNNIETLRHLFQNNISLDILFSKNNSEETVLHKACKNGNLEIAKIVLNKLDDDNTNQMEQFIYSKNKDGQTCFHIACTRGYFNLIEFFLKDKKMNTFLEHYDNNANTSLHLATLNGHSSIVTLLLEHGIDVNAKNEDNITALDLSCRKGFFEISKNIINNYSTFNQNEKQNEYPLHVACYEGAYEVVKLLLLKGTPIDRLNNERKNCLDIAISRGHREVIRVLLNDENWSKLIRLNNRDDPEDDEMTIVTHTAGEDSIQQHVPPIETKEIPSKSSEIKYVENPQLVALFNHKMWDIFKIVLDKCAGEKEMDFTKIDPPVKSISRHPLMLIALSGQEHLLKHETTRILLHLKWRFIPRCAFYFNLFVYLLFMLLFSIYSTELSKIGNKINSDYLGNYQEYLDPNSSAANLTRDKLKIQLFKDVNYFRTSIQQNTYSNYIALIIIICFQLFKELCQVCFLDGLSYFLSLQNLVEVFTYITALLSLLSESYYMQSAYGSVAVLSAFIVFPLFIQKLKIFGVYVVAFKRTLANSAKFFPIFLIIFTGFILSFRIRSNFDVTYFNSTSYSVIRTLTMVVGELDTAKMGLYTNSIPNYFIYFLFIGLMCTIVLNLFVGIAVGEIKTVLDEADIQQTSMRIMFVLKVQSALYPFQKTCLKRFLNMNFSKYNFDNENKFVQLKNKLWNNARNLFSSKEHTIKLSDPQKRLEDSFKEMARITSDEIKNIRFGFSNQITDTESRLANSQRRLQDSIIELSNRTFEKFNEFKDETQFLNTDIKTRIIETQNQIEDAITNFSTKTNDEFKHTNRYFNSQMSDSESKIISLNNRIQNILMSMSKRTNFQFESIKEYSINQTKNLKSIIISSQKIIEDSFLDLENHTKQELQIIERALSNRMDNIDGKIENYDKKLKGYLDELSLDTEKEIKIIKENLCNQISNNLKPVVEGNKRFNDLLTELNINLNNEIRSVKSSTSNLAMQIGNLKDQIMDLSGVVMNLGRKIDKL